MKLPAGSIKNWADLEKLFLAHFFENNTKVSVPTVLTTNRRKKSLLRYLCRDFRV